MESSLFWIDFFIGELAQIFAPSDENPTLPIYEMRIFAYLAGILIIQYYARRLWNRTHSNQGKTAILLGALIIAPVAGFAVWMGVLFGLLFLIAPPS
jgi:hypothetical protein